MIAFGRYKCLFHDDVILLHKIKLVTALFLKVINDVLTRVGFSTLDVTNCKGETALSLCSNKSPKHNSSCQLLQFAAYDKARGNKYPHPPTMLWFWYLLMPITIFCGGGIFAELAQALIGW